MVNFIASLFEGPGCLLFEKCCINSLQLIKQMVNKMLGNKMYFTNYMAVYKTFNNC